MDIPAQWHPLPLKYGEAKLILPKDKCSTLSQNTNRKAEDQARVCKMTHCVRGCTLNLDDSVFGVL